ncbi:MAG: HAD family hydrolase [Pseudomonadota bacterium]
MQSVIFDVDGTLVNSFDRDGDLFCRAVTDVLGDVSFREDWGAYEHATDAGILRDIITDAGLGPSGQLVKRVQQRFGALLEEAAGKEPFEEIAGAGDAFTSLKREAGFTVGVATGGWARAARTKLRSAGIPAEDVILRSSSDHFARQTIMLACLTALGEAPERPVYVGDGQWDVDACRALNWAFVGIGPRLEGQCPVWLPDFSGGDILDVIYQALAACHGDWARA